MKQYSYDPEDFRRHLFAIREAGERGVISKDLSIALEELWQDFRNENYYRIGVPGSRAANLVLELAERLHGRLVQRRAAFRGSCECSGTPREGRVPSSLAQLNLKTFGSSRSTSPPSRASSSAWWGSASTSMSASSTSAASSWPGSSRRASSSPPRSGSRSTSGA